MGQFHMPVRLRLTYRAPQRRIPQRVTRPRDQSLHLRTSNRPHWPHPGDHTPLALRVASGHLSPDEIRETPDLTSANRPAANEAREECEARSRSSSSSARAHRDQVVTPQSARCRKVLQAQGVRGAAPETPCRCRRIRCRRRSTSPSGRGRPPGRATET